MKELLISSLLGIVVLAADILKLRKLVYPIAILGMLALVGTAIFDWGSMENPFNNNMLLMDNFALGFIAIFGAIMTFWFVLSTDHFGTESRRTDLYALTLFSLCGAVLMVSYTNLVMLFLGIEILSIPLYVLAASNRKNLLSNEAGFKYFFLGSLASAILLFGIALVYGTCGTFDIPQIATACTSMSEMPILMAVGVAMILVGFAFKISAAPFHFWAPDVYQGSPTVITGLMATVVKGAAFAAMYRLFSVGFGPLLDKFTLTMGVLSGLTLIAANVVAITQTNMKRLMAYSSISHAGFMLAIVMTANITEPKFLMFYVLTYSIASLTAFATLYHVSAYQNGAEDLEAFKGLAKRNPMMAGAMTIALFSMAGIPPIAGFMAKYFVISSVVESGQMSLAIIMILTSVLAVFYYLKIIVAMFTPIENAGRIVIGSTQQFLFGLFAVLLVALFFGASVLELIPW